MATALARAHIEAQRRLRELAAAAVASGWAGLPGYDEKDVDRFLELAVPLVATAQRQAVALTEAFLAQALRRQPLGLNPADVTGAAVRAGTASEEVYRRPFVTVWTALGAGKQWEAAVAEGLVRAASAAATDVQLSMRATASAVGELDPGIYGYQRVTDGSACLLCQIASTQRYHTSSLMPIHAHCGCSVEPLTSPADRVVNRDLYRKLKSEGAMDKITAQRRAGRFESRAAGNRQRAEGWRGELAQERDPARRARLEERARRYESRAEAQEAEATAIRAGREGTTAEVRPHGELGPVLVNADHHFTTL